MSPSFGPTSLKSLESTMNRYYHDFLNGIEERANRNGGIVEMNEWFHNLSFDVFLNPISFDIRSLEH